MLLSSCCLDIVVCDVVNVAVDLLNDPWTLAHTVSVRILSFAWSGEGGVTHLESKCAGNSLATTEYT